MEKGKILIIDDDADLKIVIKNYLSNFGYTINFAANGLDGIFKASKEINANLILLDINMQELDGLETFKILKQKPKLKNIPIIFISGAANFDTIKENFKNKDCFFMKKPLKLDDLLKLIKKI